MPIRYRCPQCRQLLSIATRMAERPTDCPICGASHFVPPADATATLPLQVKAKPPSEVVEPPPPVEERTVARAASPSSPSIPISFAMDPLVSRPVHSVEEEEEEGLSFRGVERKSDELDLIPMVDCVFLLLVFYMITASYALQKTIDMGAPAPDKKGALQTAAAPDETAQSSVVVQIDSQNRIFVDDVQLGSAADLVDTLRGKMNGEQKNELVIQADPQALHETEIAVVDAAHELQFQRIRMSVGRAEND